MPINISNKMQCAVYKAVEPINWLIGKWVVVSAKGCYPTINPFEEFCGELEFTYSGEPLLIYEHRTWNPEKQYPTVIETGFLRIKPRTRHVAFSLTHNSGMVTVEEGTARNKCLNLKSTSVSRISFLEDPLVVATERRYILNDDMLEYVIFLETKYSPMAERARIIYKRIEPF